jgi:hypothetical protein
MGIFFKVCPQCTTTHAATADHCGCGYRFGSDRLETPEARLKLAAQEERIYEAYLAARLVQARTAVEEARLLVKHNPKDEGRQHMLADAEALLRTAAAELKVHRDKAAYAAATLKKVMPAIKTGASKSKSRRKAAVPVVQATPTKVKSAASVFSFVALVKRSAGHVRAISKKTHQNKGQHGILRSLLTNKG